MFVVVEEVVMVAAAVAAMVIVVGVIMEMEIRGRMQAVVFHSDQYSSWF